MSNLTMECQSESADSTPKTLGAQPIGSNRVVHPSESFRVVFVVVVVVAFPSESRVEIINESK